MAELGSGYLDFNFVRRLRESPLPFAVFPLGEPEEWQTCVPPGTRFCGLEWRSGSESAAVMDWLDSLPAHSRAVVFMVERSDIPNSLLNRIIDSGRYDTLLHRYGDEWKATPITRGMVDASGRSSIPKRVRRGLVWLLGRRLPDRPMREFAPDQGFSYRAYAPSLTRGNELGSAPPKLLLFEDDRLLPSHQAPHNLIRAYGRGRYSKWFPDLFFSSSDNSDPRSNGRVYRAMRLNPLLISASIAFRAPRDRWFRPRFETEAAALKAWAEEIGQDNRSATPAHEPVEPKRVAILLGALAAGGAERQVANLALGLAKRGIRVDVLALNPLMADADRHYVVFLQHPLVRVIDATVPNREFRFSEGFACLRGHRLDLLDSLPSYARDGVWPLLTHLITEPPDVMHAFLDRPNLIGGLAGWLLGVPRILLSTRSLNPSNFPTFHQAWFRDYYILLHRSRRVRLCGNSMAGIRDYAQWMGVSPKDFFLTRNGLDPAFLETSGTPSGAVPERVPLPETPTIAGLFRLAPEKRPDVFLRVVRRVRSRIPGLKVRIAGDGPLEGQMRELIRKWKLESCVELLGRTREVRRVIESASLVLLTSDFEGTPNVLLEAQFLGRPVVTTRAGGAAETLDEGKSGYSCDLGDISALAESCVRVLRSRQVTESMGEAGREFVLRNFSLETMLKDVEPLYLPEVVR